MILSTLVSIIAGLALLQAGPGREVEYHGSTVRAEGHTVTVVSQGAETSTDLPVKGEVIGLAANDYACYALTDAGEICRSRDMKAWTAVDFNETYRGYYDAVRFVGIAAGTGSVAVVGTYEGNGAPAMFVSSMGNVWSERTLTYSQGDELFELGEAPLAVRADIARDEYVLTCTDGVLFFVPSCSHCNRIEYHGND